MKKLIIVLIFISSVAFAGEYVQTPQYLIVRSPTTNQVEKMSLDIVWGDVNTAYITWRVVTQDRTKIIATHTIEVSGADFMALFDGFASILNLRAEAIIWQDTQDRYTTQATP